MIILDLSQIMIAHVMTVQVFVDENGDKVSRTSPGLMRHGILSSILSLRRRFHGRELVIACDGRRSWRKSAFPHYKARRQEARDSSFIDWGELYATMSEVTDEIMTRLPYRTIRIEDAEGDDVIAVVATSTSFGPVTIVSGDHDFIQLHSERIDQYDPVKKIAVKTDVSPGAYLNEHIIRGDTGDGIPNVLSDDDCLVKRVRQKPITKQRLAEITEMAATGSWSHPTIQRNYERNRSLIDLTRIPQSVSSEIMGALEKAPPSDSGLMEYLMEKRLKKLMESLGDF